MKAIVQYDINIRNMCEGNHLFYTSNPFSPTKSATKNEIIYDKKAIKYIDPKVIYNMYYPPCIYNPDLPNENPEPCLPFPENAYNPNNKDPVCVDGKNLKDEKDQSLDTLNVNKSNKTANNNSNFRNLQFLNSKNYASNSDDFLMIYNKMLIFNHKQCKKKLISNKFK